VNDQRNLKKNSRRDLNGICSFYNNIIFSSDCYDFHIPDRFECAESNGAKGSKRQVCYFFGSCVHGSQQLCCAFSSSTLDILTELVCIALGRVRETSFLFRRISVAVHRLNSRFLHDTLTLDHNTHPLFCSFVFSHRYLYTDGIK